MARPHRYAKRGGREFWSTGVLRPVGIAPRDREVGDAFSALARNPGLWSIAASWQFTDTS